VEPAAEIAFSPKKTTEKEKTTRLLHNSRADGVA
jgi:hypothetical protein